MDTELEDEEEEGDKILKEVLDEIGVDLSQQLVEAPSGSLYASPLASTKQAVAVGETSVQASAGKGAGEDLGGLGGLSDDDALQARLDALRRG